MTEAPSREMQRQDNASCRLTVVDATACTGSAEVKQAYVCCVPCSWLRGYPGLRHGGALRGHL